METGFELLTAELLTAELLDGFCEGFEDTTGGLDGVALETGFDETVEDTADVSLDGILLASLVLDSVTVLDTSEPTLEMSEVTPLVIAVLLVSVSPEPQPANTPVARPIANNIIIPFFIFKSSMCSFFLFLCQIIIQDIPNCCKCFHTFPCSCRHAI